MKKVFSIILICAMCFSVMSLTAFADTSDTIVNDNGIYGAIIDPDGNVVEYLTMSRSVYVNKVYTINAGHSLITYQYEPTENFFFGFTDNNNGVVITDSRCTFDLSIELSNSIGAENKKVWETRQFESDGGGMIFSVTNDPRRYCNGKLTNTSSYNAEVRVIILLETTLEEIHSMW